ncbi:MAG: YihY/virulence factor BrkB family protein [Prolixibacteraceae bacterium]|nr:YihY/virulence factor BrkB family protein [Prolixibacteraceae bacterium]
MNFFKRWYRFRLQRKLIPLIRWAQKVTLPGFDKIPIYDVGMFFLKGLKNGAITTRASSVAFNLFLAMFPAVIFIFTLIPLIPVENFQVELLLMIESIVPESAYEAIQKTIEDKAIQKTIEEIIFKPHGGLLSLGFVLALYFSTNGIASLIQGFNASVHVKDTRSWIEVRAISIVLILIISLLVTIAIILITFTQTFLNFLVDKAIMDKNITYYMVTLGKWFVIVGLFYFAFSFLYFLGPARKSKYRFISAGSSLATVLSIVVTLGFSFYIDHFGRYNALYGSIGTVPVIMLMIYFNCVALIVGFELNIGIVTARRMTKENT